MTFDLTSFLKNLPQAPGVYRMINSAGEVIYVGKAKSLKKRVSSYFLKRQDNPKTAVMVSQIAEIAVILTQSETEALILEHNLIKDYRPRYNVIFKDNKTYPYLILTDETFPRLSFYRGAKKAGLQYFGPYPSWQMARESQHILQKVFQLRTCEAQVFEHRTRPCLQYQIKRCTAPCVGLISAEDYQASIKEAALLLRGKSQTLLQTFDARMKEAVNRLDFETAALWRDKIQVLRRVQEQQTVQAQSGDLDILALKQQQDKVVIEQLFIRGGQVKGNQSHFPQIPVETSHEQLMTQFIEQHYLSDSEASLLPPLIVTNIKALDKTNLMSLIKVLVGRTCKIMHQVKQEKRQWLALAEKNAHYALESLLLKRQTLHSRFLALGKALGLSATPQRLECFDISHTQGQQTVASCVVYGHEGPLKRDYRYFNIEGITPGDDYAAMHQALTRRFLRLKKGEGRAPDVLLIDGGKGQLSQAQSVLRELGLTSLCLLGVAKGVSRKPGLEMLWLGFDTQLIELEDDSPALHLIQAVRDEAHRFAITGHRNRREKQGLSSVLEQIEGVGPKRRIALLRHFGGIQRLQEVSAEEIAKVEGISLSLAQRIYERLH